MTRMLTRTVPMRMPMTVFAGRDPFTEFDELIRRTFPTRPMRGSTGSAGDFTPAAEITRDGDDALVRLELPGLDFDKDITVEMHGRELVIRGERRDEREVETSDDGVRYLREFRYGSFRRSFTLPEGVTAEHLSASYDAGVLTVRVDGAYAGTAPRKIAVTAGSAAPAVEATTDDDVTG